MVMSENTLARCGAILSLSFLSSLAINVFNKQVFGKNHYNLKTPLFAGALYTATELILALLVIMLISSGRDNAINSFGISGQRKKSPVRYVLGLYEQCTPRHFLLHLIPCAIATALSTAFGNASLRFISLALYVMVKCSSPFFLLIFAIVFGIEKVGFSICLAIIALGFGLALTLTDQEASYLGLVFVLMSSLCSGLRWVLVQLIIEHQKRVTSSNVSRAFDTYSSNQQLLSKSDYKNLAEISPGPLVSSRHYESNAWVRDSCVVGRPLGHSIGHGSVEETGDAVDIPSYVENDESYVSGKMSVQNDKVFAQRILHDASNLVTANEEIPMLNTASQDLNLMGDNPSSASHSSQTLFKKSIRPRPSRELSEEFHGPNSLLTTPLSTIALLAPLVTALLIAFSFALEGPFMIATSSFFSPDWKTSLGTILICIVGGVQTFVLALLDFQVVHETSVLIFALLGVAKEIALIVIAVIFLGESIVWQSWIGSSISIVSVTCYYVFKRRPKSSGNQFDSGTPRRSLDKSGNAAVSSVEDSIDVADFEMEDIPLGVVNGIASSQWMMHFNQNSALTSPNLDESTTT